MRRGLIRESVQLEVHYKEKPPSDFLEELVQLVESHPEVELSPFRCILDCSPAAATSSPASSQATAPPAKKSKKGCPAINKRKYHSVLP